MQALYQQESRREAILLKNQKESAKKVFGSSAEILKYDQRSGIILQKTTLGGIMNTYLRTEKYFSRTF